MSATERAQIAPARISAAGRVAVQQRMSFIPHMRTKTPGTRIVTIEKGMKAIEKPTFMSLGKKSRATDAAEKAAVERSFFR